MLKHDPTFAEMAYARTWPSSVTPTDVLYGALVVGVQPVAGRIPRAEVPRVSFRVESQARRRARLERMA
jgi:hypothetical protein